MPKCKSEMWNWMIPLGKVRLVKNQGTSNLSLCGQLSVWTLWRCLIYFYILPTGVINLYPLGVFRSDPFDKSVWTLSTKSFHCTKHRSSSQVLPWIGGWWQEQLLLCEPSSGSTFLTGEQKTPWEKRLTVEVSSVSTVTQRIMMRRQWNAPRSLQGGREGSSTCWGKYVLKHCQRHNGPRVLSPWLE